jgi:hypothetical protein
MMDFVTFKWRPSPGYRSKFEASTVNTLHSMLGRNFHQPFRLTCITDDPKGISAEVRVLPLWEIHSRLPSPHGINYPSCYRRLPLFAEEFNGQRVAELIGPRFACMDLDLVILGDVTAMFAEDVDFRIWGDTAKGTPYNGSLWMLRAGARRQVWDQFDPVESPKKSLAFGYIGSDQGWIGACLGPNERKWSTRDGVYSFRNHIQRNRYLLPANARVVIFHGAIDPWGEHAQRLSWVRKHYR